MYFVKYFKLTKLVNNNLVYRIQRPAAGLKKGQAHGFLIAVTSPTDWEASHELRRRSRTVFSRS
jgi:hypothetical protein